MIWTLDEWKKKKSKTSVHKYGAVRCESKDGVKFPSKLEKMYYERLIEAKNRGEISYFLMQVPFRLPGNIKYLLDFMVIYPDNRLEYIEVKGFMSEVARIKIQQTESIYNIKINVVKSA